MKKTDILTEEYKEYCIKRIIERRISKYILCLGYSVEDFVNDVITNSWLRVNDNVYSMATIATKHVDWLFYKLTNKRNVLQAVNVKAKQKREIHLCCLNKNEKEIVELFMSGHNMREIATLTDRKYFTVQEIFKSAKKKLKKDLTGRSEMLESSCPVTHSSEKENDRCREDTRV